MAQRDRPELDSLLIRASRGDESAFRKFYDLSAPAILAFLTRMLRDRFQAEDILQDTMVIVWNKASDFDPDIASARTWVTTIARRRALDALRSSARQRETMQDGADDIRTTLSLDSSASAAAPESDATAKRLASCFDELSSESATCVQLAYLYGLTFSEISKQIDRSLNSVKSWIRRGLAKLQACMQT